LGRLFATDCVNLGRPGDSRFGESQTRRAASGFLRHFHCGPRIALSPDTMRKPARSHSLAHLIGIIVSAAAAAAAGAVGAACDSAESTITGDGGTGLTPISRDGFTAVKSQDVFGQFKDMTLDARYDGILLRSIFTNQDPDGGDGGCTAPLGEAALGNPCAKASDAKACGEQLACLFTPTSEWKHSGNRQPEHYYFIAGKDGVLGTITTRVQLLGMLGSVDTQAKAVLLSALDGGDRATVVAYRGVANGNHEVIISGGGPCASEPVYEKKILVTKTGVVTELQKNVSTAAPTACVEGRRPAGLVDCPAGGINVGIGEYLAEAAHLEAAAVAAFAQMISSLRAMGAPESLVAAADKARRDEIRHARAMTRLAAGYGCAPKRVELQSFEGHSAESLALENIVEGCVRETYSAVRAAWQATHAQDPAIRAAFQALAAEEAQHAELSWSLAAWLDTQIDAKARDRVQVAYDEAIESLRRELRSAPHGSVQTLAGVPSVPVALRLLDEMLGQLGMAA
jgi:hypothetical protein